MASASGDMDDIISLDTFDTDSRDESWEILNVNESPMEHKGPGRKVHENNKSVTHHHTMVGASQTQTPLLSQNGNGSKGNHLQEWIDKVSSTEETCDFCQVIKLECPSKETLEFWKAVPETSDPTSRCHIKFYRRFYDLLKQTYPKEPGMKNTRTTNLLKRLLRIPDTEGDTARVSLENVVRLVRLFGPIKAEGDRCVLIQQLQILSEKSLQYPDGNKTERMSWFAGEMSREEAEQRLQKESDNTYLIRISCVNDGDFALSVKHSCTIYHFGIKGQPEKAVITNPFSAKLLFMEKEYDNLVQIAEELSYNAITPHDESDSQTHIWCRIICPGLPLNGIIKGYRKAKQV